MDLTPSYLFGKVMHARLFPAKNAFTYGIYYLAFRLRDKHLMRRGWLMGVNGFGLMSFYDRDHGNRDGGDPDVWIRSILETHGVRDIQDIILVCMPRILGYVFNPVSFWFCIDAGGAVRAVLCEVNNTFGETHSYLCCFDDGRAITADEWMDADKVFHVSPFLPREGSYKFRFQIGADKMAVQINHHAAGGDLQLVTTLGGRFSPMSRATWIRAFFGYPLVTFRTVALIHWQALKLFAKRQKFYTKPVQNPQKLTKTNSIKKM